MDANINEDSGKRPWKLVPYNVESTESLFLFHVPRNLCFLWQVMNYDGLIIKHLCTAWKLHSIEILTKLLICYISNIHWNLIKSCSKLIVDDLSCLGDMQEIGSDDLCSWYLYCYLETNLGIGVDEFLYFYPFSTLV